MRNLGIGGIILLSCILCVFAFTQVPLTSALHSNDNRILIVSVESPSTNKDYSPGEVVPVIVIVSDSQGIPMSNASVLVTSSYDMQLVHVPFLKVTQVNQSQAAVFGPNPSMQVNQSAPADGALEALNDAGFVEIANSPGDWSLELQIEPLTAAYLSYQTSITVHVAARPPIIPYLLLAVGWILTIGFVVFVVRKRIRAKQTSKKRARKHSAGRS